MSNRVVLVTGARGFIGSSLLAAAQERGGSPQLIGVDIEDADLRDRSAVDQLLARVRPTRVVHLAATLAKGQDAAVLRAQREHTFETGTVVIDAALAAGIHQILVPGSIDEFGGREGELAPSDPCEPRSYYGLCKSLLREHAAFRARTAPVRIDWFRPFIVYGPGQTQGGLLLPTLFRAAKNGERAQVSDGIQRRDFIHVADVAAWILQALTVPMGDASGSLLIHHLGTGEPVAVRTVIEAVAEEFPGSAFDIGAISRRPGEPLLQVSAPYASADAELAAWRPRYQWRRGIAETAAWWKDGV
ncbi:MAG TPA: NAD(P)-dependent oxidoreductase [Polyangiaceae bacterium]|jgi:nucleoside-diphosphate-sugar epimerase